MTHIFASLIAMSGVGEPELTKNKDDYSMYRTAVPQLRHPSHMSPHSRPLEYHTRSILARKIRPFLEYRSAYLDAVHASHVLLPICQARRGWEHELHVHLYP